MVNVLDAVACGKMGANRAALKCEVLCITPKIECQGE